MDTPKDEVELSIYLMKAINYALDCHGRTNHEYAGLPYSYHLQMVAKNAQDYIWYFDQPWHETIIAAAWCHDLIEDTRQTYNDVRKEIGKNAADIVYALTNEKGKTRKERANQKYYTEMKQTPFAVYVKLCDRMANVQHAVETAHSMLQAYKKEHAEFKAALYNGEYSEMWWALDAALIP